MSTLKTNNIQHVDLADPSILLNSDGSVSIAGTVSYEDATNVDSVGIITGRLLVNAQKQIHVGTGVSVKAGGLNVTAGITTVQALQATTGTFSGDVTANGGDITISGTNAILHLVDSNDNPNYRVQNVGGVFQIYDATSDAERLRVDSNGNIGVNGAATNISNQRGISIKGAGSNASGFVDFIDASGNSDGRIIADNGTITINADTSAATASSKIEFNVDNSNKININASGNLLVATQSTTNISGNADDIIIGTHDDTGLERGITFAGTVAGGIRWNDGSDQGVIEYSHADNSMRFSTATAERLRIDSSGRVIITNDGVTNPTGTNTQYAPLVVRGNTSATSSRSGWLTLARSETSANISANEGIGEIFFGDQQAGEYGAIKCFADAAAAVGDYPGRLSFWTTADGASTATEKLRITSAGKIGINQSTPDTMLHLTGDPASNGAIIRLENTTAMGQDELVGSVEFEKQDASGAGAGLCGGMRCHSDDSYGARTYLAFSTRGNSTGAAAVDTERFRITAQGGVTFNGDTAYANALNDYEEGSWTPECRIETRAASDSPIDSVQGNYIKVGDLVYAFGQFTLNGTPSERSDSRAIEIRNFPYAHSHNFDKVSADCRVTGFLTTGTYGSDIYFLMRMLSGQTYARLEIIQLGYNGTRNASNVMQDNMNVIFQFTYPST